MQRDEPWRLYRPVIYAILVPEKSAVSQITYQGKSWRCSDGANLRREILDRGLSPYNGKAHYVNCRGLGTCGTCAVEIGGEVSPMTPVERWRRGGYGVRADGAVKGGR